MFDNFSEVSQKFANIQGAIVTNEVQQRSYYALWCPLKGQFFITGMGDTIQGIPSSLPANRPRQASSLSGINGWVVTISRIWRYWFSLHFMLLKP